MKRRCSCHIAPLIAALALLGTTMVSAAPSDPLIGDQWALDQVGATCAWQSTTGSRDIIVAIVDSGVDLQHPDFADRILPFDTAAARRYADLAVKARAAGRGFPTPDGYIAAIAAAHSFAVASRDTSAFKAAGLTVIDPWEA